MSALKDTGEEIKLQRGFGALFSDVLLPIFESCFSYFHSKMSSFPAAQDPQSKAMIFLPLPSEGLQCTHILTAKNALLKAAWHQP